MKEQVIAGMLTLSLALGFIFSIEVLAQNDRMLLEPCVADLQKYCPDAEPGSGYFLTCLEEKQNKLTVECRRTNRTLHEMMIDLQGACVTDLMRYCDDVTAGGGQVMKCLKENTTKLTNTCKVKIENAMQNQKSSMQSQWP